MSPSKTPGPAAFGGSALLAHIWRRLPLESIFRSKRQSQKEHNIHDGNKDQKSEKIVDANVAKSSDQDVTNEIEQSKKKQKCRKGQDCKSRDSRLHSGAHSQEKSSQPHRKHEEN